MGTIDDMLLVWTVDLVLRQFFETGSTAGIQAPLARKLRLQLARCTPQPRSKTWIYRAIGCICSRGQTRAMVDLDFEDYHR